MTRVDPLDLVRLNLNFQSGLSTDARAHQQYLAERAESFQQFLLTLVTGAVAIVGSILVFFGIKDRRSLKRFNQQFQSETEAAARRLQEEAQYRLRSETEHLLKRCREIASEGVLRVEGELGPMRERISAADAALKESEDRYRRLSTELGNVESQIQQHAKDRAKAKLIQDADDAIRTPESDSSYRTTLAELQLKLIRANREDPGNVALCCRLGMIYSRLKRHQEAADTLRFTLRWRRNQPKTDKEKVLDADLRFNIACYLNAAADALLGQGSGPQDLERSLRKEAWQELIQSFVGNPVNWHLARVDAQLQTLIKDTSLHNIETLRPESLDLEELEAQGCP